MRRRIVAFVVGAWIASLIGVGLWAQTGGRSGREILKGQPIGPVISGGDLGFQRIAGDPSDAGKVFGKLMVRINGQWVPVESQVTVVR